MELPKTSNGRGHTVKITVQSIIKVVILAGMIGGGLLAFGFRLDTPADHVEEFIEHTNDFNDHLDNFEEFQDAFVEAEAEEEAHRVRQTQVVEAQTKLTCLRTGADTLLLLNLIGVCSDLGVPRP